MSIIIDANRAGDFAAPICNHAGEIIKRIASKRMRVAVGGRLLRELANTQIRGLLVEWSRAGRLVRADDNKVDAEEVRFEARDLCSDDPHVLGLASVCAARLIYTADTALMKDFKNPSLFSPRGKIVAPGSPARVATALFDRFGT